MSEIEDCFKRFLKRDDIDIILINQNTAEMIRHVIDAHTAPLPAVLEIPSKDHPYDASKDSILRRAKVSFALNQEWSSICNQSYSHFRECSHQTTWSRTEAKLQLVLITQYQYQPSFSSKISIMSHSRTIKLVDIKIPFVCDFRVESIRVLSICNVEQ